VNGFAHPWLLAVAAAVPLLLALLTAARNRHQRVPALATAKRRLRPALAAPGIALLGLAAAWAAAAGPAHIFMSRSPSVGRDLVVLLDVSASMGAPGPGGDALAAARRAVQALAAARPDDRLALVAFGARAAVVSPLTHDHATLTTLMSNLAPAALGARTALGDGLAVALELLHGSERGSGGIILVTDGESNAGVLDPLTATEVAAERGIPIDAVAVSSGTGEGDSGRVNETLLRAIASRTGGHFVHARDGAALAGAFADLARLQPVLRAERPKATAEDRSAVPARWAACLLFAAAMLDAVGRRAWA
jgi:Ca-activated chloride channel family protein